MSEDNVVLLLCLAGLIYAIPSFIALCRNHRNLGCIFVINLLAGWTLLGWIAALVWAVYEER